MLKSRRNFLKTTGASLGVLAFAGHEALAAGAAAAKSPNGKSLAGVFPIGWTPCKADNSFDADAMVKQQKFLNRGKVAGMAWPQNASGWQSLTPAEWNAGAEALVEFKRFDQRRFDNQAGKPGCGAADVGYAGRRGGGHARSSKKRQRLLMMPANNGSAPLKKCDRYKVGGS